MHKIPQHDFERFIRRNLLRAIKFGYSPEEIIDAIRRITQQGFEVTPAEAMEMASEEPEADLTPHASHQGWTRETAPTVAITECSLEQSEDLAQEVERRLRVNAIPLHLDVLRNDPTEVVGFLGPRTLYVTTPFHQVEVAAILATKGLEPYILDLSLSREFLSTLKRLERYHTVGVLCRDDEALAAASSLVRAYLKSREGTTILEALVGDPEAVARLVRDAEIVIHAPNCRLEAGSLLPWGIEKVETTFDIDPESLQELGRLVEAEYSGATR